MYKDLITKAIEKTENIEALQTGIKYAMREALYDGLCGTSDLENYDTHGEFCNNANEAQEKVEKYFKQAGLDEGEIEALRWAIIGEFRKTEDIIENEVKI